MDTIFIVIFFNIFSHILHNYNYYEKTCRYLPVLIFLFTFSAKAQEYCITSDYSPNKALLLNTTHQDYSQYAFCVKIYVHVIRKSNHTGGQSISDVNEALSYLDLDFNPYRIYFDWDNVINYIDNTSVYNNPAGNWLNLTDHNDGVYLSF